MLPSLFSTQLDRTKTWEEQRRDGFCEPACAKNQQARHLTNKHSTVQLLLVDYAVPFFNNRWRHNMRFFPQNLGSYCMLFLWDNHGTSHSRSFEKNLGHCLQCSYLAQLQRDCTKIKPPHRSRRLLFTFATRIVSCVMMSPSGAGWRPRHQMTLVQCDLLSLVLAAVCPPIPTSSYCTVVLYDTVFELCHKVCSYYIMYTYSI